MGRVLIRVLVTLFGALALTSAWAGDLVAGTKLDLVLLRSLSAGHNQGERVPLMVADDVVDNEGHLVVSRGTILFATVTWTRREGTLSSLFNQPARLALALDPVRSQSGEYIPLTGDKEGDDAAPLQLTRENTGRNSRSKALEALLKDKEAKPKLMKLQSIFDDDDADCLEDPEMQDFLARMADRLEMPDTAEVMEEHRASDLLVAFRAIRRGASAMDTLGLGVPVFAAGAVLELADVAGTLGSRMGRVLKGRTINARVGTRVQASVLGDRSVPNTSPCAFI